MLGHGQGWRTLTIASPVGVFFRTRMRGLAPGRPRKRRLELDDRLAGPLVALAEEKVNYEWDWAGAERLYRQAVTLNSNDGMAHHGYATYLAAVGRNSEAIVEARRAHEVEPLSEDIQCQT